MKNKYDNPKRPLISPEGLAKLEASPLMANWCLLSDLLRSYKTLLSLAAEDSRRRAHR